MEQIGIVEAKAHFSEVVDRVLKNGVAVTVTRHGEPVVDITPTKTKNSDRMSRQEAQHALAKLREEVEPMSVEEIVELVHQGRC